VPENNEHIETIVLLSAKLADDPEYDRVIYPKIVKLMKFIKEETDG